MVRIEYVDVAQLKLNPKNPRSISPSALEKLCASIKDDPAYFEARPILCNAKHIIIAGTQRYKAAVSLGLKKVPTIVLDNPELEAKRMLLDNLSSGEWDYSLLGDSFDVEFLKEVGFSDEDLVAVSQASLPELDDDIDIIPPKPLQAKTKPGDLWLLGEHRLLCGDSSKPEDVDRLLAGARIHTVNSDPPYGVSLTSRSNNGIAAALSTQGAFVRGRNMAAMRRKQSTGTTLRAKDRPIANDDVTGEEFAKLLHAWFSNIARALEPGRAFYIWGGFSNIEKFPTALQANGLYYSQLVLWIKQHPVMNRKDYMCDHECAFYGWREGAAHKFYGPNNARDVWEIPKVSPQKMIHLTEKPVALALRAVQHGTLKGENVLDLFGGSGSTLIACELATRKAFLCEIDPAYCDVICQRYERLTNKKGVLEGGK